MKVGTFIVAILWFFLIGCAHKLPESEAKKPQFSLKLTKVDGIDKEEIKRIIFKNLNEIRSCYEHELDKNKNLYGKVVLGFDIVDEGKVKGTSVRSNTTGSIGLDKCMRSKLKLWTFPSPPNNQIVRVTYPFVFRTNDKNLKSKKK